MSQCASSPPALPTIASINDLPIEVLTLIFANIAFRPLLLVLRRVCKRWNQVAPLAVKSLEPTHWRHVPEATLLSFSNISTISGAARNWSPKAYLFLSQRIRSISAEQSDNTGLTGHFPLATSLRIVLTVAKSLSILLTHHAQLTRLSVFVAGHDSVQQPFFALRMPALTELDASFFRVPICTIISPPNVSH